MSKKSKRAPLQLNEEELKLLKKISTSRTSESRVIERAKI